MIICTSWHGIVLSCFPSGCCRRCTSRWPWRLARPYRRIPQHLCCTALECVPRQPYDLSVPHHFGPDATFRRQQQVLVRLVHTAYPDRFDPSTVQLARSQLVAICDLRHDHFSKWHKR